VGEFTSAWTLCKAADGFAVNAGDALDLTLALAGGQQRQDGSLQMWLQDVHPSPLSTTKGSKLRPASRMPLEVPRPVATALLRSHQVGEFKRPKVGEFDRPTGQLSSVINLIAAEFGVLLVAASVCQIQIEGVVSSP